MKILHLEIDGFTALPHKSIVSIAGYKHDVISVQSTAEASENIENCSKIDIFILNAPNLDVCVKYKNKFDLGILILVTDLIMEDYAKQLSYQEHQVLDHVIANSQDKDWTSSSIRITIQKILNRDFFGIEKYFFNFVKILEHQVSESTNRDHLNHLVMDAAKNYKLGNHIAKLAYGICEELLMNAIYDAPKSTSESLTDNVPRSTPVTLGPKESAILRFGCDGSTFAISVSDPFGGLSKDRFFQYLKKVLSRNNSDQIIDRKKGGAGLGLFKILYSCHSLVCNSEFGKKTEVIALINLNDQVRDFSKMPRSISFF